MSSGYFHWKYSNNITLTIIRILNLQNRYTMRGSAIFIILICYIVTFSNTSLQMFSIEEGKVYSENFNVNHTLNSSYTDYCHIQTRLNEPLASSRKCNHLHVILPNDQTPGNGFIASHYLNSLPTASTFPPSNKLYTSAMINLLELHTQPKSLLPNHLPLLNTSVLLIWQLSGGARVVV